MRMRMRSCVVPFRAREQYVKDLPSAFSSSSNSYSSFLQSIHLLIFLAHPCLIPSTAMTSEYQTSYVSPLPLNVSWNIAKQVAVDKLLLKIVPSLFASIEILEGGVGAGTVRLVTFGEGNSCIKRGALYLLCIPTFRDAIDLEIVHGHVLSIEI